jgi:hypothetical protein
MNRLLRFRLQTILLLIVPIGVGLAWWRDRTQLVSQLDLRERQIKQLQKQVDEQSGFFFSSNLRFKTPDELVEFVKRATEDEFSAEEWGLFAGSYVADQSVEPLVELLRSPRDETRHQAAWLLGVIGRKKRPAAVDPIPALVTLLDDPSSRVRAEATYAIRNFGTLAKEALPTLQKIMQRDLSHDAFTATLAVKEIDPSVQIGPRLRELFLAGGPIMRQNVASRLPDHLPAAEAKQLLMAAYEHETDNSTREALAQAMNRVKE